MSRDLKLPPWLGARITPWLEPGLNGRIAIEFRNGRVEQVHRLVWRGTAPAPAAAPAACESGHEVEFWRRKAELAEQSARRAWDVVAGYRGR